MDNMQFLFAFNAVKRNLFPFISRTDNKKASVILVDNKFVLLECFVSGLNQSCSVVLKMILKKVGKIIYYKRTRFNKLNIKAMYGRL